MKRLKLFFACLLMAVLSIGQVWATDPVTYASWAFTSESYPENATDFEATSGSFKTGSTFNLDGTGSTWNATKGYAFTKVDYIYLTLTLGDDVPAGTEITFAADMYYNKASNAPMTGFTVAVSVDGGTYTTTGLDVTSISLSNSSANKAIVYTTQSALDEDATITLKYTQTGKVGAGQGFFNNITITAVEGSGSTPPSCTDPTTALSITNANTATIGTPLTLTTTGGNAGTITWSVAAGTGTASVTGNTLTPLTKGTVTVTATQDDNEVNSTTYCGAAPTQEITINKAPLSPIVGGITDVLDNAWTGKTTSNYGDVAEKTAANTGHSTAKYKAQCAGDKSSVQLRSNNNNSGVISSVSAGLVKRVVVAWHDDTDAARTLQIYGKNTAYSTPSDLYSTSTRGDLLGTLNKGEEETTLDFTDWTGDYKYIGIRSASGAMYLTTISITWVSIPKYAVTLETEGCSLDVQKDATSISTGDEFEAGQTLSVSYSASTGYENAILKIKKASDNSDVTGAVLSGSTITVPDYAIKVVAAATKKHYTVTLSAANGHVTVGGNTETSISVAHGETAQLTAVADDGYSFNGWTSSDGTKVALSGAKDNPVTITVTGAATVTAAFVSTAKTNPGFEWSANSAEVVKGQTPYSLPTLSANPHSLTPTYVSTNTDVAEIDGDGVVTIKAVGSTTIKATYTEDATYAACEAAYTLTVKGRVTWHAKKAGFDATTYADYVKDAVPTKPTGDFIASCHSSISLVGWTTEDYKDYSDDDDAPSELYTASDDMPGVTDNVDYYAVWGVVEEGGWSETALGNISSTDVVVIVGYDGEDYYGIKSNGTSGSPIAVGITVENGKITSTFDDENNNIKWNITGNATDGYSFYVNGGTADDRLYCSTNATSSDNKSWRVGNPASGVNRYTLEWSAEKNTMATKDESTARYLCLYPSGPDWRSYVAGSVTTTNLKFYKHSAGSTTDYTTNCLEPLTVATPAFTPDGSAAYYTSAQDVEISCATGSSTIYYTTDGTTTPDKTTGTPYTGAIHVETTTTIKAIAYVGDVASEVAEATFTIHPTLTTIQGIFDEATAIGGTAQARTITFDNWIVSAISSDDKSVYVTDNTKGFVIYVSGKDHGFAVGNVLSGTVECDLQLYTEFAEIKDLKASNTSLTVTTGGVLVPADAEIKNLGAVNTGAPVILSNVTYDSDGDLVDDESYYVKPDNMLYSDAVSTFEQDKIYNVTGVYVYGTTADRIAPRSAADIVKLSKEQQTITWYVSNAQAEAIGTSYSLDNKDVAFAPVCVSNSTGAKTYQSSNTEVATINENTGVIEVLGNGVTTITCNVVGDENYVDGSKAFTLKVGIGEASWVAATWASANNIESNTNFEDKDDKHYATIAIDANVSMTWAKATSSNVPAYNYNAKEARLYQNATLTFTASNSKQITRIVFNFTSGHAGTLTANDGTYNGTTKTWTGFTSSVMFTNTGSAAYIKSIDIEYAEGTTTTLEIEDIELSMLAPAAQDIIYTSNKANPTIVYSGYDDTKISIVNGQIAPLAVGSTNVTASIAADAPYSSAVTTFKVTVKSGNEVEENVVILAQKDGRWYALTNNEGSSNNSLAAIEVDYFEPAGKILTELTPAQKTSITWKRITDGNSVTFQDANNKYLTGTSGNTNLSIGDAKCEWTKSGNDYLQGDRTFLYSTTNGYFRCYNSSTADVTDMPIFVASNNAFGTVYTRQNVSDSKYGTICLPNGGIMMNGTLYEISYYDAGQKKIFFDEVVGGVMVAGAPYIFKPNENVTELKVVYTDAANVENAGHKNGLYGHYDLDNPAEGAEAARQFLTIGDYFLRNNEYWLVDQTDRVYVDNYRAYIKLDKIGNDVQPQAYGRRRIDMNVNGEQTATGFGNVQGDDAQCTKVLIDGQMYILRGEKMYDATGRLVK